MKVYLAGGIKGIPDYHERFSRHADALRKEGHSVYNPASANQEGRPLSKIMATLLPILCEQDAVAAMPEWDKSGGGLHRGLACEISWQRGHVS